MSFFTLIKKEEVRAAPQKKVIPSKEFATLATAEEILKKVKQEEVDYRLQVASECEGLKEKAEDAGFQEGLQRWNRQLALLEKEVKEMRQEIENSLVPLALAAVKKIIGKELKTHRNTIVDIIATALKTVGQHRRISIYVNQSDLDTVEEHRPFLKKLFEHLETLTIAAREDVAEGGCIIETEAGIINAQLENQLGALESAFRSFFQNHKKEG